MGQEPNQGLKNVVPSRTPSFMRSLQAVKSTDTQNNTPMPSSSLPSSKPRGVTYVIPKIAHRVPSSLFDPNSGNINNSSMMSGKYYQSTVHQASLESTELDSAAKTVKSSTEVIVSKSYKNDKGTSICQGLSQESCTSAPQEILTHPSSLNTASADLTETNAMKSRAIDCLEHLRKITANLEEIIQLDFDNLSLIECTVQRSELILYDVTHNLHTAEALIETRSEQLEAADKRIRLLMGDELGDCTNENLEDISDILWSGLQAATLAIAQRQHKPIDAEQERSREKGEELRQISTNQALLSNIPEAKFSPLATPQCKAAEIKADELCAHLISTIEEIRDIERNRGQQFQSYHDALNNVQNQIKETNDQYGKKREELLLLEKKLNTRSKQVNRLTGRDNYENLTLQQLVDLCKTINKASRRLTTEQAIREVRAQEKTRKDGEEAEDKKCFVCYERNITSLLIPCKHKLCGECADRLNFCPRCRNEITGKTLLDTDGQQKTILHS